MKMNVNIDCLCLFLNSMEQKLAKIKKGILKKMKMFEFYYVS